MKDKIKEIIALRLYVNISTVTEDAPLKEGLEMDSLDLVELTMHFEDEFDISIPDEDAEKWKTVGDIIKYLERRKE